MGNFKRFFLNYTYLKLIWKNRETETKQISNRSVILRILIIKGDLNNGRLASEKKRAKEYKDSINT